MKPLVSLCMFALCGAATAVIAQTGRAEIKGRILVSKVLTKKRVTMPSYELRGVAVDALSMERRDVVPLWMNCPALSFIWRLPGLIPLLPLAPP